MTIEFYKNKIKSLAGRISAHIVKHFSAVVMDDAINVVEKLIGKIQKDMLAE